MGEESIVNKVAASKLYSFDMEEVLPAAAEIVEFDLKPFLFHELVLKEMDFRQSMKNLDWSLYQGEKVLVTCSVDVVIPIWAYMLVSSYLNGSANAYSVSLEDLYLTELRSAVKSLLELEDFSDRPVIVKGCSNIPFKEQMYLEAMKLFLPHAKSIMFGEPCSTVPIWKRK